MYIRHTDVQQQRALLGIGRLQEAVTRRDAATQASCLVCIQTCIHVYICSLACTQVRECLPGSVLFETEAQRGLPYSSTVIAKGGTLEVFWIPLDMVKALMATAQASALAPHKVMYLSVP
jgi:hypothetical protein